MDATIRQPRLPAGPGPPRAPAVVALRHVLCALALVGATAVASAASRPGAELTLEDGRILAGASVTLKQGVYELTLEEGAIVSVPAALVRKLRLSGGEDEAEPEEEDDTPSGLVEAEPRNLAGPPEPRRLPRPRDMLEAFGRPPARFVRPPVETHWTPASALKEDVTEFSPVRWYRPPIDPTWTPVSAFKKSGDVTEFNPTRWYRPQIDPIWWPKDGWRRPTRWFGEASSAP